jgi:metal-responsive CopG/Arc/MetJ family transcriptional regulator
VPITDQDREGARYSVEICEESAAGYTTGMKTAVSIPDDVFEKADRLARRAKRSRSEVFTAALREYVARHSPEEITEALNSAFQHSEKPSEFVTEASRRILDRTEW